MKSSLRTLLVLGPLAGLLAGVAVDRFLLQPEQPVAQADIDPIEHALKHLDPTYVCPMHAEIVSNEPGSCPICGMDLVRVKDDAGAVENDDGLPVVTVAPTVMSNLGVRTVPVERKTVVRRVDTPGFIQQIKKARTTRYKSPFAGRVTKFLFEKGEWYEPGAPLMELESEEMLAAQQRHLELLAMPEGQEHRDREIEPAVETVTEELIGTEEPDEETQSPGTVGGLTDEQRAHLSGMGLDQDAIAAMEKEFVAQMAADTGKAPELPAETREEKPVPVQEEYARDAAEVKTLEESRKRLAWMGMRKEDIQRLEEEKTPSSTLVLYSMHPGKVIDLKVEEGDEVGVGTPLFGLGGQVRVTVLANAFQRDAAWIRSGQRAEIRMPHVSGEVWPGIVNHGSISINPNSQNIGVKLGFTAPFNKVKMNQYVVGTVYGEAREDVIAVPVEAVIRTENEERVVVALGDGRFRPVVVTTGVEGNDEIEIIKGLEEGDEVVVMAQFLIDSESSLKESFRRLGEE